LNFVASLSIVYKVSYPTLLKNLLIMSQSNDCEELNSVFEMKNFQPTQILLNNAAKRTLFLLGGYKDSTEPAIVILEKVEFDEESVMSNCEDKSLLRSLKLETIVINDIYGNFFGEIDPKFNSKNLHCYSA
jgi:Scavenger mRNA decapping enzyme (DcpS) N-terminal